MFGIPINIATAVMEDIYERLCWLYVAVRDTLVCDAIGNSYPLSDLSELSEAQIPYPERFVNKPDYEQKLFLKDLQMKDVLCTRTTWIIQGRDSATMADLKDAEGNEVFINLQGVPLKNPTQQAQIIIEKVQNFPTYLLEIGNEMIGKIMELSFEQVAPRAYGTLSWVWELQRIKIALQNNLARDPEAVRTGLIHVMHTKLDKYSSFVKFRRSMAIFTILWERSVQKLYLQFADEFANHLVISQLRVNAKNGTGELQNDILTVLVDCCHQIKQGRRMDPIDVMNRIEQTFVNLNLEKGLRRN
jgi:hypothetical protein